MELSNENINEWVQILINASSSDEITRKNSEEAISQKMNSDTPNLIMICTQVLIIESPNDDNLTNAKCLASILLTQMLSFQSESSLDFKRKNLSQEMADSIKQALIKNIFSPNSTIRNKCSQLYSILFSILTINWPDGIEFIINSFSNLNLLPFGFIGLISIMREIVNQKNFLIEIIPNFESQFTQTFLFCSEILSKGIDEQNYTVELRIESVRFIYELISNYPQILNEEKKIEILLSYMQSSFPIDNVALFNFLHQLLFLLVKKYYMKSYSFMEIVANYVGRGLSLDPQFASICILFWESVANFEDELIEKEKISKYQGKSNCEISPLKPLLTAIAAPSLMPFFVSFMEKIDENDVSVDNVEMNRDLSMYSYDALSTMYRVAPDVVFNCLKEKIVEDLSIDKWTYNHAGIQMIYSICDKPILDHVGMFISQKFDLLLKAIEPENPPRLRETSLFVIAIVFKNYPEVLRKVDEKEADMRITHLIASIESTLVRDSQGAGNISYDNRQIYIQISRIIRNLASVWSNNTMESQIGKFFDDFYRFIGVFFNLGITHNDQMLINESSLALDSIIINSPPYVLNKIDWLYSKTLEMLIKSNSLLYSNEIKFVIQSCLCSNITKILTKLRKNPSKGKEIVVKYTEQTLSILYDFLSNKNTLIYEEGLRAISALISATNIKDISIEIFTPDSFERLINEFIQQALLSQNENVINAACILISNLFLTLSNKIPILNNYIPVIFDTLSKLIMNHKEMRNTHSYILSAIAKMFNNSELRDDSIYQLELPYRQLLLNICNTSSELCLNNEDDVEYGNSFYRFLTEAFGGYAKVFYNSSNADIEREQLLMLNNLAKAILVMNPKISIEVLEAFVKTARQFADNCTTKNNSVLNKNVIHKLIDLAISKSPNFNKGTEFKETKKYLYSK